ncbi:MAG: 23S rRNA (pseudouridine(1915)-N(3))-methyltransferase RlmH [Muribaculaceae bacterium]|nr:23S rRNA (pseudouridine(1915)-N(3))-methyltransferase RlmH [Muribaculaceae bacterium]
MKLLLTVVGKTSTDYLIDGIDRYVKRIGHYIPFELKVLPDVKVPKNGTTDKQKQLEGSILLTELKPNDTLILLDERGKQYTSREFASFIDNKMVNSAGRIVFAVGGPYGFSQEVYARANGMISLSKMTFSHEMVRLFFVEQIYRAMTILRGEPYHHD